MSKGLFRWLKKASDLLFFPVYIRKQLEGTTNCCFIKTDKDHELLKKPTDLEILLLKCPIHKTELYTFEHNKEEGFCTLCNKWISL